MKLNKISSFVFCLLLLLLVFNGYYFFIHRGLSPFFYIQKFTNTPTDNILESEIYKDLSEEYFNFNKNILDSKIVFVGDSITKRFNLHEFCKNHKIINRGIFSDTTHGLLNRLESNVNNLKIEKLFVMIGYNDLKFRTNEQIVKNIIQIVTKSKSKQIYIQSLLPVRSDEPETNERIIAINENLNKFMIEGNYIYVALHSYFIDHNNGLKSGLSRDGVHLNYLGYKLWFALIEPLL